MKKIKDLATIVLAIFGLVSFNSCSKNITCECDVEDYPDSKVYIDITNGKCEDLEGTQEFEGVYTYTYYGYQIDLDLDFDTDFEDCKED